MVKLYWNRADGQGSMEMGTYESEAAADAAIPAMEADLIEQCATDEQEDGIRTGTWSTSEDDDGPEDQCSNPKGHEWAYTGTQYGGDDESYGGEGRCYCAHCGADGDG